MGLIGGGCTAEASATASARAILRAQKTKKTLIEKNGDFLNANPERSLAWVKCEPGDKKTNRPVHRKTSYFLLREKSLRITSRSVFHGSLFSTPRSLAISAGLNVCRKPFHEFGFVAFISRRKAVVLRILASSANLLLLPDRVNFRGLGGMRKANAARLFNFIS